MFKNMTVGAKIAGGFAIALVLTAVIGLISIYYMSDVGKIVNQLATQEIPETSAVVETERAMWHTHVLSYEFDIKLNEQSKKEWFDQRDMIGKAVGKIVPIATALNHQETLKAANGVKKRLAEYAKVGEEYTSLAMANKGIEKQMEKDASIIEEQWTGYISGQNEKIHKSIADQDFEDVVSRITKLKLANDAIDLYNHIRKNEYLYILHQHPENADTLHESLNKLISMTQNTFMLSKSADDVKRGELALEYTKKFEEHMDQWIGNKKKQVNLLKQSDRVAMGIVDLASKTAIQADKDAYDVGVAAVDLVNNVKLLLIVLLVCAILMGSLLAYFITRGITRPVNRIIEGLNDGAEQVAAASSQVSSASQSLAEGSSEQAASIEETSASLEEMSSMTKQNAQHSREADQLMKEANQGVGQANDSMNRLTRSMGEISTASEETSKIIKTIDEIAFQTNLLALNAAVEAARAGEAGAGFAVVADEVRNLAMRAADAAKSTAELIEGTVKKVNDGSGLVAKTNADFNHVATNAGKVGELVGEIAAASSEQAQGIDQVNTAVAEMDKVVQQNASTAEESASASEEMNAQSEQMKAMVNELVVLVGGTAKGKSGGNRHESLSHGVLPARKADERAVVPHKAKALSPGQVIPMDEEDYKDF